MSEDVISACRCGATEAELDADGRQMYVCDECGASCCSDHSENGPGISLYCDDCYDEMIQHRRNQ